MTDRRQRHALHAGRRDDRLQHRIEQREGFAAGRARIGLGVLERLLLRASVAHRASLFLLSTLTLGDRKKWSLGVRSIGNGYGKSTAPPRPAMHSLPSSTCARVALLSASISSVLRAPSAAA